MDSCCLVNKKKGKIISKELKPILLKHLTDYANFKNIYIKEINCEPEHVHALLLSLDRSIGKVIQFLKGELSYWINQNKLTTIKFDWQEEYYAVSVSESQLEKVVHYIREQAERYRRKSFLKECDEFMEKYGFSKFSQ